MTCHRRRRNSSSRDLDTALDCDREWAGRGVRVNTISPLIHLAASELPGAVPALARPLAPGGLLVMGLHAGDDVRRMTNWFEVEVPALDFVLHGPASVVAAVKATGLTDVEWYLRGPHEWRDETTQRLYVVARRV